MMPKVLTQAEFPDRSFAFYADNFSLESDPNVGPTFSRIISFSNVFASGGIVYGFDYRCICRSAGVPYTVYDVQHWAQIMSTANLVEAPQLVNVGSFSPREVTQVLQFSPQVEQRAEVLFDVPIVVPGGAIMDVLFTARKNGGDWLVGDLAQASLIFNFAGV